MDWNLLLQIAGVALGLLYLWLEYRADIRLWIVGLVMPAVHGALYFRSGLYADCSMQLYYIAAGLYGWAVWRRAAQRKGADRTDNRTDDRAAVASPIRPTPWRYVPGLVAAYAALHGAIYLALARLTDSTVPFWDSLTTALCIVAYWMLSRKLTEQWLVWLAVDLVCVGLYLHKQLPLTAGLYALYSALAVAGYLRWRRAAAEAATGGR
ncbi:nicotinamide riboside transporter PnuC [uncultured Alistipes sp.]|uniref:nicotinamide riboside transporter PnuC n=1 Tax=uncultured Alistipes sp. TaxID=538949 RepID=UPI00261B6CFE|nr:nicotinamide riboside transporter PnuC [uncultured Alistipes sp.]